MDIAKLNDKKPQGPQRIAGTGTDRCRNLRCRYQFAAIAVISGCGQSLFQTAKRPYLRAANGDRLGLWQFLFLGTLLFQPVGFCTQERMTAPPAEKRSLWQNLTEMWRMQSYRRILLSGLLRTPSGLMNLLQMTVLSYYFGNNGRTPYVHYMLLLGIPAF